VAAIGAAVTDSELDPLATLIGENGVLVNLESIAASSASVSSGSRSCASVMAVSQMYGV